MSETIKYAIGKLEESGFDKDIGQLDYDNIIKSFCDSVENKKRGMMFIGEVGCGKTLAISALAPKAVFIDLTNTNNLSLCKEYEKTVTINGVDVIKEDWWTIIQDKTVILDDLGNEPIISNYGIKQQIVANFILQWYSASFKNENMKARLLVTTNLTEQKIVDLYGARIADRLFEMVNIVYFKSSSHRKAGTVFK